MKGFDRKIISVLNNHSFFENEVFCIGTGSKIFKLRNDIY